jgi:hypothetical protein
MARRPNHTFTREEAARGGRARAAKVREEQARAREFADEQPAELVAGALAAILTQDEHPIARIRAVREVLDRVLGKPVQRTELTGDDGGALELTLIKLAELAEAEDEGPTT